MKIDVTVTKEQIFEHITDWDYTDILKFIIDIDETMCSWDFTILIWLHFDKEIKSGMDYSEVTEDGIELVKEQYMKGLK